MTTARAPRAGNPAEAGRLRIYAREMLGPIDTRWRRMSSYPQGIPCPIPHRNRIALFHSSAGLARHLHLSHSYADLRAWQAGTLRPDGERLRRQYEQAWVSYIAGLYPISESGGPVAHDGEDAKRVHVRGNPTSTSSEVSRSAERGHDETTEDA